MTRRIIGIGEKLPFWESLPLSFQHLTAMFGATILVPILLGIDPAIALLMNGIGTLIYSWVTKGGIPAYLFINGNNKVVCINSSLIGAFCIIKYSQAKPRNF